LNLEIVVRIHGVEPVTPGQSSNGKTAASKTAYRRSNRR
jgi:hypothetical protein